MVGYIPIPSPRSTLERGCFDPLVATQTVGGQCRADRHCVLLKNTNCTSGHCHCASGYKPSAADPSTGLVLGCELGQGGRRCLGHLVVDRSSSGQLLPLSNAASLGSTLQTGLTIKSLTAEAILKIDLLQEDLNRERIYTLEVNQQRLTLKEEWVKHSWIGNFQRFETRKSVPIARTPELALWIRYRYLSSSGATIQVGLVNSDDPLLDWTDSKETALRGIAFLSFESRTRVEVLTDCET